MQFVVNGLIILFVLGLLIAYTWKKNGHIIAVQTARTIATEVRTVAGLKSTDDSRKLE